jgi:NADP-dependent 3-hydroxy acid dehydrogenase YdfG
MPEGAKTFLITGVSSGFGRAFAQAALEAGHTVIGTVRSTSAVTGFERLVPGRAVGRVLDLGAGLASDLQAEAVVADAESTVGPIDVLVANAGYGHEGTFEESSMEQLRDQFAVNVFGAVAVMKAVLPGMRQRRRGHILAVTSVGGLIPSPTLSFYAGSKFALEGITRSLAVRPGLGGVGLPERLGHRVELPPPTGGTQLPSLPAAVLSRWCRSCSGVPMAIVRYRTPVTAPRETISSCTRLSGLNSTPLDSADARSAWKNA